MAEGPSKASNSKMPGSQKLENFDILSMDYKNETESGLVTDALQMRWGLSEARMLE